MERIESKDQLIAINQINLKKVKKILASKMENEITVIFVSFHSDHIIEKSIQTIDERIRIIVVENSKNLNFKSKLENKYPNIKVIIPEENLGNGAGINQGLKNKII